MAKTKEKPKAAEPAAPNPWTPAVGDKVVMKNGGGNFVVAPPQKGDTPDMARLDGKVPGSSITVKLDRIEPAPDPAKADAPEPPKPEPKKPAAKAAPVAMEPDELAQWRSDVMARTRDVEELHDAYLESKEAASSAKRAWESAVERLQDFILDEPEEMPLFDVKAKTATNGVAVPVAAPDPSDEAGRREHVSGLSVPGKVVEKLTEAGMKTIGDIADHTAKGGKLTDFLGRGEAEKAEAALAGFWDKRRAAAIPRPEPASAKVEAEETAKESKAGDVAHWIWKATVGRDHPTA